MISRILVRGLGAAAVMAASMPGCSNSSPTAPGGVTVVPIVATGLSSFEGLEEPVVLYHPSSGAFTPDEYTNMTNPASGLFRFTLRYHAAADWWDGDRDTTNTDRQRAEVKGLGPHQKPGETFEYATTWRTSRGGTGKFWHVFQLKATNGDDDLPVVVLSIQSDRNAAVRYWPGNAPNFIVARALTFLPDEWTTVKIRIKVSNSADGTVLASVNGDAFSGASGVAVFRPGSTDYRPKWGSYRGVDITEPYGDDVVEHRDISAAKIN